MNDADREKQLAFLEEYCAAHFDDDGLDELVHEEKSKEAAAINNGGVSAQLEYLVEGLGTVETARAIMGADAALPECFRVKAAPAPNEKWRVTYRVCAADDGAELHLGTVTVTAPMSEAHEKAIAWAHENDPHCDDRIEYYIEVVRVEQAEKDNQDEQDDPS